MTIVFFKLKMKKFTQITLVSVFLNFPTNQVITYYLGFVNLRLPYNIKQFFNRWGMCSYQAFFLMAPNITCLLIHHVPLYLVLPIAHLLYHVLPQTQFPPHFPCKPRISHHFPSQFKKPHTTHQFPLLTSNPLCECEAPTLHFPLIMHMQDLFPLPLYQPVQLHMIRPPTHPHFLNTFATFT